MKYTTVLVWFILLGTVCGNCMAQERQNFADLCQAGGRQQYLGRPKEALAMYKKALAIKDITLEQQAIAQKGIVEALTSLRQFSKVRSSLEVLMTNTTLAAAEKVRLQQAFAETYFAERKYPRSRTELAKALRMTGVTDADKADIQLQVALSYYEAGNLKLAKPQLEKILTMPTANSKRFRNVGRTNYTPAHEAKMRLLKMQPDKKNEDHKTITVLFVGSSMTIRGYMPKEVEKLSNSAPAGRVRIMSSNYIQGGTDIDTFWRQGNTRDTARGTLAAMPWDFVVLETFETTRLENLSKYGKLFADLARRGKTEPIFYESHPEKSSRYPQSTLDFHKRTVALGKLTKARVAPVALAEIYYVEAVESAKRDIFYADGIHPSPIGVYLEACCIYATITGYSPVGLAPPGGMSEEHTKALQEAAWKAVRETNPNMKPMAVSSSD